MSTVTKTSIPSLRRGVIVQARVIFALVMREIITRYGRSNIGFLWLFCEPMLFTIGVTLLWSFTKHIQKGPISIVAFAITGYSTVLLWRNTSGRCVHAIEPNLSLLYHRNVKVLDVLLARIFLEIAGATASFTLLTLVSWLLGFTHLPTDISKVLIGWVMTAWFGMSLALVLGALSERTDLVERTWHTISYLLFPLSGVLFIVDWLPKAAQQYILLLPMVNGVEMIREGYFGNIQRFHYNFPYMLFACASLTLAGLILTRLAERHLEIT